MGKVQSKILYYYNETCRSDNTRQKIYLSSWWKMTKKWKSRGLLDLFQHPTCTKMVSRDVTVKDLKVRHCYLCSCGQKLILKATCKNDSARDVCDRVSPTKTHIFRQELHCCLHFGRATNLTSLHRCYTKSLMKIRKKLKKQRKVRWLLRYWGTVLWLGGMIDFACG